MKVTFEVSGMVKGESTVIFAKDFDDLYLAYEALNNFVNFYNSLGYEENIEYRHAQTSAVRDRLDKDGEYVHVVGVNNHGYWLSIFLREEESDED